MSPGGARRRRPSGSVGLDAAAPATGGDGGDGAHESWAGGLAAIVVAWFALARRRRAVSRLARAAVAPACAVGLAAFGCTLPGPESATLAVTHGEPTVDYPAVVALAFGDVELSGAVIAPRVVLTAAHGLEDALRAGTVTAGVVRFGRETAAPDAEIGVIAARTHRYYGADTDRYYDIALVLLDADAPAEPLALHTGEPAALLAPDDLVTLVGYGQSAVTADDFGTKRTGQGSVTWVDHRMVVVGRDGSRSCRGDSGSPYLVEVDGALEVVAVAKSADRDCSEYSTATAIAPYLEEFIYPVMDRWVGACTLDGACSTETCRTPDPDCDPCGYNGVCAADCAAPDLDCPLRGRVGALCERDVDCESGYCIPALDRPELRVCALPCSEHIAGATCAVSDGERCAPLDELGLAERVCRSSAPTPLPPGAACARNCECASLLCHRDERSCVEPCSSSSECASGQSCVGYDGVRICAAGDDGGCSVAGPSGGGAPLWLLGLVAWAAARFAARRRPVGRPCGSRPAGSPRGRKPA